jgi:hypothetical protein
MKRVCVIGANGNMGKRYAMILEQYCDCEVLRIDVDSPLIYEEFVTCDGFIIATPTEQHASDIVKYAGWKKPILCEKPITKSISKLHLVLGLNNDDISMINQYAFLDHGGEGHTEYNYFKTGSDGLMWDCINIIGLARSSYSIKNDSVVWKCVLNGDTVNIGDMDQAYIDNIKAWVSGSWRNKSYILAAHENVARAINARKD